MKRAAVSVLRYFILVVAFEVCFYRLPASLGVLAEAVVFFLPARAPTLPIGRADRQTEGVRTADHALDVARTQ